MRGAKRYARGHIHRTPKPRSAGCWGVPTSDAELALLAKETLGHDPMKGVAVVLRAKCSDRVKIVVWDGSGVVMYWKRLDGSGFKCAPPRSGK
ncbi:hypothetical protein ACVWXL_009271 [Bradyrhizobium sp. GM22.5]